MKNLTPTKFMLAHGGVLLVAPINAPYLLQNAIHLLTVPSTAMLTRYIDIAILYLHLSRSGIVSKRLNTLSYFLQRLVVILVYPVLCEITTGSGGLYKFHDFRPISGYM